MRLKKLIKKISLVWAIVFVLAIIGEVRCIYKATHCNWDPIGKAEIIYLGGAMTGVGSIVGWFNIEDD